MCFVAFAAPFHVHYDRMCLVVVVAAAAVLGTSVVLFSSAVPSILPMTEPLLSCGVAASVVVPCAPTRGPLVAFRCLCCPLS